MMAAPAPPIGPEGAIPPLEPATALTEVTAHTSEFLGALSQQVNAQALGKVGLDSATASNLGLNVVGLGAAALVIAGVIGITRYGIRKMSETFK